jgi:hypothetical protein
VGMNTMSPRVLNMTTDGILAHKHCVRQYIITELHIIQCIHVLKYHIVPHKDVKIL